MGNFFQPCVTEQGLKLSQFMMRCSLIFLFLEIERLVWFTTTNETHQFGL